MKTNALKNMLMIAFAVASVGNAHAQEQHPTPQNDTTEYFSTNTPYAPIPTHDTTYTPVPGDEIDFYKNGDIRAIFKPDSSFIHYARNGNITSRFTANEHPDSGILESFHGTSGKIKMRSILGHHAQADTIYTFYPDGTLASKECFKNGSRHGECIYVDFDGVAGTRTYIADKPTGDLILTKPKEPIRCP